MNRYFVVFIQMALISFFSCNSGETDEYDVIFLKQSDSSFNFFITSMSNNVLYKGIENIIDLSVTEYPAENITLSVSGGAVARITNDNKYVITIDTLIDIEEVNITVYLKSDDKRQDLGTKSLKVYSIPSPNTMISIDNRVYKDGSKINKESLSNNINLCAKLEKEYLPFKNINYTVTKFDFLYFSEGQTKIINVFGDKFTQEIINIISNLEPNSPVTFTNVYCTGPSGTTKVNGLTVFI